MAPVKAYPNLAPGHGQSTVPGHLSGQFRQISDSGLGSVQASLEQHYFAFPRVPKDYLASEWGKQDLQNHLVRRLGATARRSSPGWTRPGHCVIARSWRSVAGRVAPRWPWRSKGRM